jgi:ATPase subunit of ABC transporter with duplicated ATPase domains
MDEPSNHLDSESRHLLYHFIQNCPSAILLVSHDRALLNHLDRIGELSKSGIHFYGGNYNFYAEQKRIENNTLLSDLKSTEKALAKAKEKERDVLERRQKLDARAKKRQVKMGTPKVMMGMLKNNAEKSRGKLLNTHSDKIAEMRDDLIKRRSELNDIDSLSFSLSNSHLHRGKVLFKASELNISYQSKRLWERNLNVDIHSADRIAIKGKNGSGKSTLIKIILGRLNADAESLYRSDFRSIYLDQDYSLINTDLTVYEQVLAFNKNHLEEHELKTRLSQFLFDQLAWSKSCAALSGGEKMRLVLACLSVESTAPDLIVLDEPTNNIDLETIHILTKVVSAYKGTLLVVSHDDYFLNDLMIDRAIEL